MKGRRPDATSSGMPPSDWFVTSAVIVFLFAVAAMLAFALLS